MKNDMDIAKMEFALQECDNISKGGKTEAYSMFRGGKNRTADTVLYEKAIGDKSYYIVQAVVDTKAKTVYIVTAFIGEPNLAQKKGNAQLINAKSPNVTSKGGSVVFPSDNLSQNDEDVNSSSENKFSVDDTVTDRDYLTAVKRGDMKTAQRMVDKAAAKAIGSEKNAEKLKKIADACETMLQGNSKLFTEVYLADKNLAKSLLDSFNRIINHLKNFIKSRYADTEYGKAMLNAADEMYENVQNAWNEAVKAGAEAVKKGAVEGEIKEQARRYAKQGGEFANALTGAEWNKYNHAMSTGIDSGLRVSDNSILVECEEGNIYDYKFVIYDNTFEDNPIKSIYAIGNLDYTINDLKIIADYIYGVEERRYAKQKMLKEVLRRNAEKFGYVLR